MKRIILVGIAAIPFLVASCGGSGENTESNESTDSTAVEAQEVETVSKSFTIDTAETVVNWNNFDGEEVDHEGTVKAQNGSVTVEITGEDVVITDANLVIDMNSISEGSEKLEGHLKNEDFFNIEEYGTSEFVFDRHENATIYGKVKLVGQELEVAAPATVAVQGDELMVEVGEFTLDFSSLDMPFFVREVEENTPAEEMHSTVIGFSANIHAHAAE